VLDKAGMTLDDISLIIPHQANLRIIQAAAKGLNLPMERLFVNLENFGNTSTASIPLAVADAIELGRIQPNDRLVLVGFGAGLTWGAILIDWQVEPTARSQFSEVLRESWYILARVRSLLLRLRRFVEALLFYPRKRRKNREEDE
jgi:3-oxoacyl-[acyl-carrier-protein] synthase-3